MIINLAVNVLGVSENLCVSKEINDTSLSTSLSNTPAGRRFFGVFLWECRLLGGLSSFWAGYSKIGLATVITIVRWVGLSCLARYAMTNGHC